MTPRDLLHSTGFPTTPEAQAFATRVLDAVRENIDYGTDAADIPHEAADSAANLIYTLDIREAFDAMGGLALLDLVTLEHGDEIVGLAFQQGSGQYPGGTDAVGVLALYTAALALANEAFRALDPA